MNLFQLRPKNLFQLIQSFLKTVENLNNGGCGIAALALYDAAVLEGKNPKIIYLYHPYYDSTLHINEDVIRGEREKAESCWHVVIEIDGKIFHADGEITTETENFGEMLDYPKHTVDREMLINSLTNGGWNSSFDRKKWYPKIKEMVGLEVELPLEYIGCGKFI